jgi:nitrilase
MFYFSPKSGFLGRHQKIKPTGVERLIWGEGDGSSLVSFDTKIGKLGGLICWENYMPEARMSMYKKGVEIYLAPTADARPSWTDTMKHIALEGRCFVLGCNQYFEKKDYPAEYQNLVTDEPEILSVGGSIIVAPSGEVIAGPLFGEEGVLTAELELGEISKFKMDFDVIGHYSRNDIFSFNVSKQPEMIKEA